MIGVIITIGIAVVIGIVYACCIVSSDWEEIEEEQKNDE